MEKTIYDIKYGSEKIFTKGETKDEYTGFVNRKTLSIGNEYVSWVEVENLEEEKRNEGFINAIRTLLEKVS